MNEQLFTIGQFAEKTGVTIRTLRYYDKEELLKPSYISDSRRRFYKDRDMVRLQQILAFKFLDYSLDQIKELLVDKPEEIKASLMVQREMMKKKQAHLERVILSLDHAAGMIEEGKELDLQILSFVIDSIQNEEMYLEWMKEHLPEKYTRKVEGISEGERFDHHKKSAFLFQSLKEALKVHTPDSPEVQKLTAECIKLISDILGEEGLLTDPAALEIHSGKLDDSIFPAASPFSEREEQLLGQAFEHYYEAKGEKNNEKKS
ncbi:MerR family transcriptional regulator [Metabacillus mangrovi]|nr:MerR family transcriptional regulator [Metabacillus mangrovi]